MNTFEKLCEILSDEFGFDKSEITDETTFAELGLDSLEMVDAIMRIEEEFGVEIPDEAFAAMHSVGDVTEFLHGLN